ncbi:DUF1798 family protein [Virgibacillus senegalensis]|uniref:DUF1798 family protein n=1 Tax=Virgibacillus senegalensis TaxID=1499679 RepID=UPI00069E8114|nr:DUF1798 family protein [Virgibacillus senegalensis]
MELEALTNQLKQELIPLKQRFETNEKPEDRRDKQFFLFVKEETTPFFEMVKEWEEKALQFVKNKEVTVHPQQVASTSDNLQIILMNSYYIDTPKTRYMEMYQSIVFVLDQLLADIKRLRDGQG